MHICICLHTDTQTGFLLYWQLKSDRTTTGNAAVWNVDRRKYLTPSEPPGHPLRPFSSSASWKCSALSLCPCKPILKQMLCSCLLGMGAGLWLQTLILLRLSGLCRSLGNAHPSFCLSKPCNAPSSESGKFILVPKQKHSDPGPTWNRSLKFPIWWTAVVSNLLNQFATLLRSCVSDHESRLTWPVRGLVRLHGELH